MYDYDYGVTDFDYGAEFGADLGGIVLVFYLVYMLIILGISVASYVLKAYGMYTIAKRRGIHKPWLAWIPVAEVWTLGCISDQYQYVAKGKTKNKRKALLTLNILMWAAYIAFFVVYFVFIVQVVMALGAEFSYSMIGSAVWLLVLALAMLGFAIAAMVIQYIALYDLFRSCEPDNSALYLVLSIFFSIALPVFIFICRKKDLGMPPRTAQVPPQLPQEPVWQDRPEPQEPWDQN